MLDLYAGTGVMAMEAISRGARYADLVEIESRRSREIRENLRSMDLDGQTKVFTGRVMKVIASLPGGYDVVFADPPYQLQEWDGLMDSLNRQGVVNADGIVVAEHSYVTELSPRYDILVKVDNRRYGDTSITVYQVGSNG